ncbi:hypothetical protein PTSG_12116 [Salpingoeca rosetta]|uniref:Uncharacterized protein n=1 Tax=Salpingoeca rosetta (strain ATCC 50818 / BSB-021) TaxID=946362 RepID=F2U7J6_SALR5|nr:uncharacterized protein PTSG_12116 [Salpingoeca rosetta]EGD83413.1 hypothetical protein PTSG_12116 [Salpingoeca rosetta]|eukprot:XP_004994917.1 hypothetical protein PTSG_12116 [Salpingoeca rosetta]
MGSTGVRIPLAVCTDDAQHAVSATFATRDRQHVVTGTRTGQVCFWSLKEDKITPVTLSLVSNAEVTCITECWRDYHKDLPSRARDTAVLCGFADGAIAIMDPCDGRLVHFHKHVVPGRIRSIEVFGHDHFAAIAGDFADIVIVHLTTMKTHHLLRGYISADWHVSLDTLTYKTPSGEESTGLVAASASAHVSIFPLNWQQMTTDTKGLPLHSVRSQFPKVCGVAWAPRCQHIIAVAGRASCELLHVKTLACVGVFPFDFSSPTGCAFASFVDTSSLLAFSHAGEIKCFDVAQFVDGKNPNEPCKVCPPENHQDQRPNIEPVALALTSTLQLQNIEEGPVCFSANRIRSDSDIPLITAASAGGHVHGVTKVGPNLKAKLHASFANAWTQKQLDQLPFLDADDKIATLLTLKNEQSSLNSVHVFGLMSGDLVVCDTAHLLWSLFDRPSKYASLFNDAPALRLHAHQGRVRCLFHCRGSLSNIFVSSGADFDLHIWDRRTMKRIHTFNQQCGEVTRVGHLHMDLSPVWRQCIFTAATDHSIAIYNLLHMTCVLRFAGHAFPVQSIYWLPPEESMVVSCTNGAAYIWQLETGHLEGTASGQIAKNITASAVPLDAKAPAAVSGGVSVVTGRLDSAGNVVLFIQVNLEETVSRLHKLNDTFYLSLLDAAVERRDDRLPARTPLSPSHLSPHRLTRKHTMHDNDEDGDDDNDDDGVSANTSAVAGGGEDGEDVFGGPVHRNTSIRPTTDFDDPEHDEDHEEEEEEHHNSGSGGDGRRHHHKSATRAALGGASTSSQHRRRQPVGRRMSHTTTPSRLLSAPAPHHHHHHHHHQQQQQQQHGSPAGSLTSSPQSSSTPKPRRQRQTSFVEDAEDEGLNARTELAILDFVLSLLLRWEDSTFDLSKVHLVGPCKHVACGVSGSHAKPTFLLPNQPKERRWQLTPYFVTMHSFAVYVLLNAVSEIECQGENQALWLSIVPHFLDDLHRDVAHTAPSDIRLLARFWQHRCEEFAEGARALIRSGVSRLSDTDRRGLLHQLEADTPQTLDHISTADVETLILETILMDLDLATFKNTEQLVALLERIIMAPTISTSVRVLAITAVTAGCQTMHVSHGKRLQSMLVTIIRLASGHDTTLSAACLHALSVVVTKSPRAFIHALTFFVERDDANYSEGMLALLRKLVLRHPSSLLDQLETIVDTVMRTLDPNKTARTKCAKLAKRVLSDICRTYPMIARVPSTSSATARLAVGAQDGKLTIFDLKTATVWKVVQAHSAPISATAFDPTCKYLITFSLVEKHWRVWQLTNTLFGVLGASCKKVKEGDFSSDKLNNITQRDVLALHMEWRDLHRIQMRTKAGRISFLIDQKAS